MGPHVIARAGPSQHSLRRRSPVHSRHFGVFPSHHFFHAHVFPVPGRWPAAAAGRAGTTAAIAAAAAAGRTRTTASIAATAAAGRTRTTAAIPAAAGRTRTTAPLRSSALRSTPSLRSSWCRYQVSLPNAGADRSSLVPSQSLRWRIPGVRSLRRCNNKSRIGKEFDLVGCERPFFAFVKCGSLL